MPLFPARPDRRASASRRGPAVCHGVGDHLLVAFFVCVLCLTAVACNGESTDSSQPGSLFSPADLFSRHAPKVQPAKLPQPAGPLRILCVGDSLSISLGEQLERALGGAVGVDFSHDGTRSTGLTRPELLNWPVHLRERLAQNPPDVVIIMIGANDVMPVEGPDGSRILFENPSWPEAYAAKAAQLVAICRAANPAVRVYWVGVPTMGEEALAKGVAKVNAALAAMCAAAPGCRFIDTQQAFSDPAGRYSRHGRDAATGEAVTLRTADGVHMTEAGARILAGVVLAGVAKKEKLPPIAGVSELRAYARDVHPVADQTVAAAPAAEKPQPKAHPSGKTYGVRKGDTLRSIAQRLGVPERDLTDVNPGVDSTRLSIGQTLRIPLRHKR